jgi:hypothetical protein
MPVRGILRFVDQLVARLLRAGASEELTLRMDPGFCSATLIRRLRGQRVRYSITARQTKTVRAAIAAIPEQAWVPIAYQPDGVAQVAETPYRGDRLIVRRVHYPGDQAQLFATWRYHALVTDRVGTATWLDADHRRHTVCELAIRDLKAGAGLAHLPSGRFAANAAWLLPPPWPTTCCAGPPHSARRCATSSWRPRRPAAPYSPCPAGSPAPRDDGPCTFPPTGPGRTRSPWRWPGCAASRIRPDHAPPQLGAIGRRRPLRLAHHRMGRPTQQRNDQQATLTRRILRSGRRP